MSEETPVLTPTERALLLAALHQELRALKAREEAILTKIANLQGEK